MQLSAKLSYLFLLAFVCVIVGCDEGTNTAVTDNVDDAAIAEYEQMIQAEEEAADDDGSE